MVLIMANGIEMFSFPVFQKPIYVRLEHHP
jgi:hypothetical protein